MNKRILQLVMAVLLTITFSRAVLAQGTVVTPPGSVSPTPNDNFQLPVVGGASPATGGQASGTANCDVCGYCKGAPVPGSWNACGRCMYPSLVNKGSSASEDKTLVGFPEADSSHYYTDLGCISTEPGQFAAQISKLFFSIIGGIAFLYFLYGSATVATARSDPERLNHGKRIVYGSIIGLLFVLFSLFIIRFLAGSLGLPGIG